MRRYVSTICSILGWLSVPALGCAQVVHETPAERILPPTSKVASDNLPDLSKAVTAVVQATNDFRKEQGVSKTAVNTKLVDTARYFADFMAKSGKYGHTADDQSPAERAKKHGYNYCIVLENIAYQYRSNGFSTEELAQRFVNGWKNSPGHRKNMLDPDVTETAVAIARSEETGYFYAVQMFGRPHTMAIEFSVNNKTEVEIEYQVGLDHFSLPAHYMRTHERCRPETLTVQKPGAPKDSPATIKTVRPANRDQFVIKPVKSGYQIEKE